ncbi:catabolic 3-dehydroquinase [Kockovaella imperatae]|uniref:Catabolic 3-dehydroquinase n=1 Tax=Kockovaella imperatae TaxID=4999 RepID=A0A1Y1UTS0_9TREE|nr:catabolic 3-dehydroquinase [Kockovaella imperatae]ORX40816.1 catabolic 3-dehydroquinase [Kockovaella imperatae]
MLNGKKSVLVINGPNLNLLGIREPHIYGYETLDDVVKAGKAQGQADGAHVDFFQSNWEGAAVDRIQEARTDGTDAIVFNPGGWTQTSVPIRDALLGVAIPFIELHVANIHAREEWRHHSYFHDKATCVIMGCGIKGYEYAIDMIIKNDKKFPPKPDVQK